MMKFRSSLVMALAVAPVSLVFAGRAIAQPVAGPYVSLGGGYNIASAIKAKNLYSQGVSQPDAANLVFKNGYDLDGAVGYGFNNGWRLEVEGDYIRNNANKARYLGVNNAETGHLGRYGMFVNGIFDFDVGLPWLYPYLGAGIGYQQVAYKFSGPFVDVDQTRGSFAYQGIFGLSFPIAPVMGLSATLDYRFIGLTAARNYQGQVNGGSGTFKTQGEYNNQFNIGLRYEFSPPAPPPAPVTPSGAPVQAAPAPVAAKTFLVFFDWDKATLTPRATQIIAQAASASKTQAVTTLEVNGYTDTSGTPRYNKGLSIRRAKAVAAQLVADGVPSGEIILHGYGETHLLVPTGPGVREPQNRRVEIIFK